MPTFDPRPLEIDEQAVLDLVLSAEFPGADVLRLQAATAVAVGRCDCGCPSISLKVSEEATPAEELPGRLVPAEGYVKPLAQEPHGEIIVFTDDRRLSYLEYVSYGDRPTSWPPLDRIEIVILSAHHVSQERTPGEISQ